MLLRSVRGQVAIRLAEAGVERGAFDQMLDRHRVVHRVGDVLRRGSEPDAGMPNMPAIDTALVLNVQRCSVGALPRRFAVRA